METLTGYKRFSSDISGVMSLHLNCINNIKTTLSNSSLGKIPREIIDSQYADILTPMKNIELAYNKFIKYLSGYTMQQEIDRQALDMFPDISELTQNQINYIKMKIILEWISSFLEVVKESWATIEDICRVFSTYQETKMLYDKVNNLYFSKVDELNKDTIGLIDQIGKEFHGKIVGKYKKDSQMFISNLIFDENLDYDYSNLFKEPTNTATPTDEVISQIKSNTAAEKLSLEALKDRISKGHGTGKKSIRDQYYFTEVIGTKDWNRNDAYILYVSIDQLKEEETKFYSSSFVIMGPSENTNINLASAMVRKNAGYAAAIKYSKMIEALVLFARQNIFTKDFPNICENTLSFLYHIGPIAMFQIVKEDMIRRDFGHCLYVDKNNILKLFPENIIKKHIIDYWADIFFDFKPSDADFYIDYMKAVQNIKDSYKLLFDQAASTRKRSEDGLSLDNYLKENTGKFFGFRRAQIFRRFIHDNIFGLMPEVTSIEKVNLFGKK